MDLSPVQWRRVDLLFHAAAALSETARVAFICEHSKGDSKVAEMVELLIFADASVDGPLDNGVGPAVQELFSSADSHPDSRTSLQRTDG
jgi:hypothetical protein